MKLKIFSFLLALMIFVLPSAVLAVDSYTYEWTKVFAGSNYEYGNNVVTDSSGNLYITGGFWLTVDFDPGAGVDSHTSVGNDDIYITKYNADGSYGWTKTFGGSGRDYSYGLTISSSGSVYSVGSFNSTVDFDPSGGVDNHTSAGGYDIFLTKYNSDGTYGWTKTFGGSGADFGTGVSTDRFGNVYLTGSFNSTVDFDPSGGVDNHTSAGSKDIFITKYNSDGTYGWTKTFGGSGDDGSTISIDSNDNAYITGQFTSTVDFDPSGGVDNHTSAGGYDIFLTKYNSDGTYGWTKTFGGSGADYGNIIYNDPHGNVYITGSFHSTVDFDPSGGVDNHTSAGGYDIFTTKFNNDGSYGWTKSIGGIGEDIGYSVTTDASSNVYITGYFASTVDFDPGVGIVTRTDTGSYGYAAYISSMSSDGSFRWVLSPDSDEGSEGYGITYDSFSNSIYATGDFGVTTDFNPLGGHDIVTTDANWSGWIMKLSHVAPLPVLETNSSPGNDPEQAQIPFSDKGNVVGGSLSPVKDSDTGEQKVTVQIEPETLKFNAFLSSVKQSPSDLASSLLPLTTKSNTVLTGGNTMGIKTSSGVSWQVGSIQKIYFKAYVPKGSSNEPPLIIPSLQSKPSIISLSYSDSDLIPAGDPSHPFKPSSLKLAYSPDGVTWSIMKSSVVDPTNKTVSAIDKLGGYYMIVSGGSTALSSNPSSSGKKTKAVLGTSTTQTDKVITPSTLLTPTEATPSPLPTTKPIQIPKPKTCVLWWCW